jgi:DNA helicase-2/ATP-dependent DNA helicase PcrA
MKPVLVTCGDAAQQAAFLAQRLLELREEGIEPNQMAVLYRSHFHALELQLELTRRNIPFSITSGIRFFEQAHVKDVAAYLKLVSNPRDELSFKRLVRLLPRIGRKGADKLWNDFSSKFKAQSSKAKSNHPLADAMQACAAGIPKKAAVAWAQFAATIAQLEAEPVRGKTPDMIRLVLEAGYEDYLQETYANYRNRQEDLEQLGTFARQFGSLEDFLTQLALLTNVEAEDNQPADNDHERIRLSTIHQAKGLEFDVVFIIMLCVGLFPSTRSLENLEGEEEERRLFYVAITRARNELYLSYPLMRAMRSNTGDLMQQPSRFLGEISKELIDEWNLKPFNPYG